MMSRNVNFILGLLIFIISVLVVPYSVSADDQETFDFFLAPSDFQQILNPGFEYENNITIFSMTANDTLVAEFICKTDNSCHWARFMINGIPSEDSHYIFSVNQNVNRTIDFVVDIPINAQQSQYEFGIRFSSIIQNVSKESQYVLMEEGIFNFDEWYGSIISGRLTGAHVFWITIVLVFIIPMIIFTYRKKRKQEKAVEDEEELEEKEIEQ